MIEEAGLLKTIDLEIERLRQLNKVQIEWIHDGAEPDFTKDQRLMSFRIFQEVVNNSLKHAAAKTLKVDMTCQNGFKLVIEDDGKGFNLDEKLKAASGSGLRNVIKRAALAHLKCEIRSTPGSGCTYILEREQLSEDR
jgi:signal transduction histidine kinase